MLKICLVVVCFSITVAVAGGEASAGEDELPDGWYAVGEADEKYEVKVFEDAGYEGEGVAIRATGEDARFGGVGQLIAAARYKGERLRLRGHLRTRDVADAAGLFVRLDDAEDEVLVSDRMQNRSVSGDTDWQQYEIVLDVPEEAMRIVFGALLSGSGEVHADEFVLDTVDKDYPVTAEAGSRELPLEPKNPGF